MKRAILAATAVVASSLTPVATPAFAQMIDPTVQSALNTYCREVVVPPGDSNAPFVITAINIVEGVTTGGSTSTVLGSDIHRNGGSPNLFVTATITTTGGSTSYTFDCETFNPNAGSASGQYPEGQQRSGVTHSLPTGSSSVTTADVVVCNSPGRNPGTWRGQNGFTDQQCAMHGSNFYSFPIYSAQTSWEPIPSNSLPQ